MRKLFLIISLFIVVSSCRYGQDIIDFDVNTDRKLSAITDYLNKKNFEGTFVLKDGIVNYKYSKSQAEINSNQIEVLSALKILGVTRTNEFTFFVTKGWKGNNSGYLYTTKDIQKINGIDEYQELLERGNQKRKRYYISTRLY